MARERLRGGEPSRMLDAAGTVDHVTAHHVFDAFRADDAVAAAVMADLADHLAVGIVTLVNIFQPQRLLIGGGVASQGESLMALVRTAVRRRWCNAPLAHDMLALAELGEEAGLIGAAGLAWHFAVPQGTAEATANL
jgi:glucokinase